MPNLRPLPLPAWLDAPRLLLVAGGVVVLWAWWPESRQPDPAIENGVRAAKAAIVYRKTADRMLIAYDLSKKQTDSVRRAARNRLETFDVAAAQTITRGQPVVLVDGHPILGPHAESDTLMALPLVRARLMELRDTAVAAIASLDAAMMVERGRASLAIQNLQALVAAQDTVISGLRASLNQRPNVFQRAVRGVTHMAAGVAGGAVGWTLGGPLAGLGGAILASAVAGVVR